MKKVFMVGMIIVILSVFILVTHTESEKNKVISKNHPVRVDHAIGILLLTQCEKNEFRSDDDKCQKWVGYFAFNDNNPNIGREGWSKDLMGGIIFTTANRDLFKKTKGIERWAGWSQEAEITYSYTDDPRKVTLIDIEKYQESRDFRLKTFLTPRPTHVE